MSGIEIVGLVLGGLPLIISALEHYEEGVSTISRLFYYKREIRSIMEALATENAMFKNSCEQLLNDFLSPVDLAEMLQTPQGEMWSQPSIASELQSRLGRSYDIYMIHVKNMDNTIKTLISRLDLDENGKVRWTDVKGFKRLMKKGKLTLSRASYQDLLLKMREGNRAIRTLTEQNRNLTPVRRFRSRYDHFRIIRDCAKEVYQALCASFSCSCVSHSINWQLDVPSNPGRTEFRIITATEPSQDISEKKAYCEVEFRSAEEREPVKKVVQPSSTTVSEKKRGKKVLRFVDDSGSSKSGVIQFDFVQSCFSSTTTSSQSSSSMTTLSHRSTSSTTSSSQMPSSTTTLMSSTSSSVNIKDLPNPASSEQLGIQIDNLCRRLSTFSLDNQIKSLGYLNTTDKRRYEVIPFESWEVQKEQPAPLSLASILAQTQTLTSKVPRLSLHDRFQLAKSISTGVLQLYNSPLLSSVWKKEDITFVHWTEKPYRKAYISRPTKATNDTSRKAKPLPYIHNTTIFALGILLIEICLGRALDDLRTLDDCSSEEEMARPSMATDYATAIRLLDSETILVESGEEYADAVRRCISCNFGPTKTDLEDDDFRQAVYSGVVAPLEKQVKAMLGNLAL